MPNSTSITPDSIPHRLIQHQHAVLGSTGNGKFYVSEYPIYQEIMRPQSTLRQQGQHLMRPSTPHRAELPYQRNLSADYMLPSFALGLAMVSIVLVRFGRVVAALIQSMLYSSTSDRIVDSSSTPLLRLTLLLEAMLTLFVGLLAANTIMRFAPMEIEHRTMLMVFGLSMLLFVVYRLYALMLQTAVGIVVQNRKMIDELRFSGMLPLRLAVVLTIPLCFIAYYGHNTIADVAYYTVLVILALSILYRWIRIALLFMRHGVPYLYFVLYLCALDIAPILVIVRLLISYGQGVT